MHRQQELILALTGYLSTITENEFFPYKGAEYNLSVIRAEVEQDISNKASMEELVLEAYADVCEVYPAYEMREPTVKGLQLRDLLSLYTAYVNMLP